MLGLFPFSGLWLGATLHFLRRRPLLPRGAAALALLATLGGCGSSSPRLDAADTHSLQGLLAAVRGDARRHERDAALPALTALRQRCLIHRCRNIVAKIPAGMQAEVKDAYWKLFDTEGLTTPPGPKLTVTAFGRMMDPFVDKVVPLLRDPAKANGSVKDVFVAVDKGVRKENEDKITEVTEIITEAGRRGVELVLPVDLVAATHFAPDADHDVVQVKEFPADREGVDIGPATRALCAAKLAGAPPVCWPSLMHI